ncbi:I78 family peptidase inhibitor [Paracoccus sp. S1E-3]|uniref:I78 family peptidase inhibitor n=1 Tax=Paracoccus sp. S1E-3 TaxID=2756130 RepID=UPI0015EEE313|nr:I78 family peptidase inhibitor [Paracoccus sp. S1E-3]MBA4492141.1 hypothetical protein [Paracoccus sp. S1E-3]
MAGRWAVAGLMLGALTACTETELAPGGAQPPAPSDACGASKLQKLVGTQLDGMDVRALPSVPRQIGPDMAVNADYDPTRLNIEYDGRNTITKVSCF